MKSTILTVAAAALLVIPTLRAQDKPAGDKPAPPAGERPNRPGGGAGGRFGGTPEERVARMKEQLGLSDEQVTKITAIYKKSAEATKAITDKGRDNMTEEDRTKLRESFQTTQKEVGEVLTPEQKKKMEEQRGQRGGPGGGRRGGGAGGAPGGAPGGDKPAAK
jgi:Spy/CpxP family protein refolding chaperone